MIVATQPEEPYAEQRYRAIAAAVKRAGMKRAKVAWLHKTLEQEPTTPGFKELWWGIMKDFGAGQGDYIVASEVYGKWLAEGIGAQFYPYDIDRSINDVRATTVRQDPIGHFDDILPEFQRLLKVRVVVFGAESTGKTTLSRDLAKALHGDWLFEYARPYLENTVNEITVRSMKAIWRGQRALQLQADALVGKPFIIEDTDLFSTVGYWQFPHWRTRIGMVPKRLVDDAQALRADLYVVTKSNIPFEADPLRYGGDTREGSDDYWEDVCKSQHLRYVVLSSSDREARLEEAIVAVLATARKKLRPLDYARKGQ